MLGVLKWDERGMIRVVRVVRVCQRVELGLESDKVSVLRDRRPFIQVKRRQKGHSHRPGPQPLTQSAGHSWQSLASSQLPTFYRFEAIHLPSSFNSPESPSLRDTANIHSPAAWAKNPPYLFSTRLDTDRCSTLLQYKRRIYYVSTELHCHRPTQHPR